MGFLELLGRELHSRRFSSIILFCSIVLLGLLVSSLTPRAWTSKASLYLGARPSVDQDLPGRLVRKIREGVVPDSGDLVLTNLAGPELEVRLRSNSPDRAFEQLNLLLSKVARDERETSRQSLLNVAARLERESAQASLTLQQSSARLEAHRLSRLDDGESALATRIAELGAELDTHSRELNAEAEARAVLVEQQRGLERRVAALQPDLDAPLALEHRIKSMRADFSALRAGSSESPARVEEIERELSALEVERLGLSERKAEAERLLGAELRPQLEAVATRLRTIEGEMSAREAGRMQAMTLLSALRSEVQDIHRGDQPLQELERGFSEAQANDLRLKEALQAARDNTVVAAAANEPPFTMREKPGVPASPDGVGALGVLCLAALFACAGVFLMLVFSVMPSKKRRLGGASRGASDPAPAPEHQVPVRLPAVVAAILCVVTITAAGFFMLAMA